MAAQGVQKTMDLQEPIDQGVPFAIVSSIDELKAYYKQENDSGNKHAKIVFLKEPNPDGNGHKWTCFAPTDCRRPHCHIQWACPSCTVSSGFVVDKTLRTLLQNCLHQNCINLESLGRISVNEGTAVTPAAAVTQVVRAGVAAASHHEQESNNEDQASHPMAAAPDRSEEDGAKPLIKNESNVVEIPRAAAMVKQESGCEGSSDDDVAEPKVKRTKIE